MNKKCNEKMAMNDEKRVARTARRMQREQRREATQWLRSENSYEKKRASTATKKGSEYSDEKASEHSGNKRQRKKQR